MTDSADTVQSCSCDGYLVTTPTRRDVTPKVVHHDAEGNEAPCPKEA